MRLIRNIRIIVKLHAGGSDRTVSLVLTGQLISSRQN
jgi:hypothetical protein